MFYSFGLVKFLFMFYLFGLVEFFQLSEFEVSDNFIFFVCLFSCLS